MKFKLDDRKMLKIKLLPLETQLHGVRKFLEIIPDYENETNYKHAQKIIDMEYELRDQLAELYQNQIDLADETLAYAEMQKE